MVCRSDRRLRQLIHDTYADTAKVNVITDDVYTKDGEGNFVSAKGTEKDATGKVKILYTY